MGVEAVGCVRPQYPSPPSLSPFLSVGRVSRASNFSQPTRPQRLHSQARPNHTTSKQGQSSPPDGVFLLEVITLFASIVKWSERR